jgi:Fic family protein
MEEALFTERRSGQLVGITGGVSAFIPDDLPLDPAIALTPPVAIELAKAQEQLGRLDGIGALLPDPEILIAPFMRKEAELSSRIEGTQTTYEDLLLYEIERDERPSSGDTREVANYVTALKHALARAEELPLAKRLLCETHTLLMEGTNEEYRSGAFRTQQVHIGQRGRPIEEARFVPAPPYAIDTSFENLEAYMAADDDGMPLLVKSAIAHYQFEAIHPYFDGNGRMGRLMIPLILCRAKALRAPMLYISAYFERRRDEYNDRMLDVSRDGRWAEWITFFLRAVTAQSKDAIRRVQQLNDLRTDYHQRVSGGRSAGALIKLVDALFELPLMTIPRAQKLISQSFQTSGDNVRRLVEHNILTPLNRIGSTQYFVARDIYNVINRAEAVPAPLSDASSANVIPANI